MKKLLLVSLLGLCACAPSPIQTWFVTLAPDGGRIHHYTGYTGTGEDKRDDSRKYLVKALAEQCGGPAHVTRLDEYESGNAFGKFLYWSGEGKCGKK